MIDKIEEFLYDLLGLAVPGLIFIMIIIFPPICFIDLIKYDNKYTINNTILSNISSMIDIKNQSNTYIIFAIILICYILGHVIKVFSKYQYDLFTVIFDRGFNRFVKHIIRKLEKSNYRIFKLLSKSYREDFNKMEKWYVGLVNMIIGCGSFLTKLLKDIFTFSSPSYYSDNNPLQRNIIEKINQKYKTNFPNKWYSIYKISNVIMTQEKLKSLSSKFLAKYNFYRSMAFLFLLDFFYIIIFFSKYNSYINTIGHNLKVTLYIVNGILWLTFHEKYKRYWTLCGNESLMSLFYYLSKPQKDDGKEKKNE
jgi:hypothetical protein